MSISELPSPMEILMDPLSLIVLGMFVLLFLREQLFPSRRLTKVAFWLSPVDTVGFTLIGSFALVLLVGVSPQATTLILLMLIFFAIFQHLNIRMARWLGYLNQRLESHSHQHGKCMHRYNYADVSRYDMLFGTFHNPKSHSESRFYLGSSSRVWEMLIGSDVRQPKQEEETL